MKCFKIKLIKEVFSLAIPISLFNLTTVLIAIANGLMLAKLGRSALAAGAIIGATQICLMMICSSPLFVISPMVSRLYAEKNYSKIGKIIRDGSILALLFSVPAIFCMIFIKSILSFFGQPMEVIELSDLYFKSYWWSVPASMLLTCAQQFMLGLKKTRVVTIIGSLSLIISVCFGYILAFGEYGFAPLGITGLAYAQVLRSTIILCALLILFFSKNEFKMFRIYKKEYRNKFLELREIFNLGWPISIHAASEYLAIFSITLFAGKLGQTELIFQQISSQYIQLLSIPILAISQASNLLVSGSIGRHEWVNVRGYGYTGITIGIGLGLIFLLGFSFFTEILVAPYIGTNVNAIFIAMLKSFLIITMFGLLLSAIKSISIGVLRSLYDTKIPMVISIICSWGIAVPLSYVSTHRWGLGINAIALSQVIGFAFCVFFLLERWWVLSFNISNPACMRNSILFNFIGQFQLNIQRIAKKIYFYCA